MLGLGPGKKEMEAGLNPGDFVSAVKVPETKTGALDAELSFDHGAPLVQSFTAP